MPMMPVKLATPRLRLRPFKAADPGDLTALTDLFADEAVQKYLAVGPMGPKGAKNFAKTFIRASADEWREGGLGVLAVVPLEAVPFEAVADDRASSIPAPAVIGYCGLRHLPDRISAVELVYALAQRHWGQGLATEAAGAVINWGLANFDMVEILAFTRPEHVASRRVMEKVEMAFQGETDRYYGKTLAVYGRGRAD